MIIVAPKLICLLLLFNHLELYGLSFPLEQPQIIFFVKFILSRNLVAFLEDYTQYNQLS
jgi:hypothetical protein